MGEKVAAGGKRKQEVWRVASYARLSHEDETAGESGSIAGQKMIIEDWVRRRGDAEIVASYADDGYSGATFERPGFRRMISDARRGLFDTIVVKDLSRFGRSYLDCGTFIERELPQMGVRLFSITDDFDSMRRWDYNMALLVPMKNLMNEMQVVMTSEKVRASLAAKRSRGECVAAFAPYGYVKDPADRHRLTVDAEAASVVKSIFAMRAAGSSAAAIARALNAAGVPSPSAHRAALGQAFRTAFSGDDAYATAWHAKTVLRILRDEAYTGTLAQGKTCRPNWRVRQGVPVPREQWARVACAHEAIVGRELFEEVAALVGREPATRRSGSRGLMVDGLAEQGVTTNNVLLSVQLYCGGCLGKMKRIRIMRNGREYRYFVCATHRGNPRLCSTHSIREADLLEQLKCLMPPDYPPWAEPLRFIVEASGKVKLQR